MGWGGFLKGVAPSDRDACPHTGRAPTPSHAARPPRRPHTAHPTAPLRRDGAVILDTKVSAPTPVEIVEAHLAGLVMPSRLEVMHGGVPVSETWFDPGLAAAMVSGADGGRNITSGSVACPGGKSLSGVGEWESGLQEVGKPPPPTIPAVLPRLYTLTPPHCTG